MNLLAIETATETCSVALAVGTEMQERYEHAPRKHAELLLPWIQILALRLCQIRRRLKLKPLSWLF